MKYRTYFPLFVDLSNKQTVVTGGGKIATRRVKTLLSFTGHIRVVAPEVTRELEKLASEGKIQWLKRSYGPDVWEEISDAQLFLAATDDPACNEAAAEECRKRKIPVNVAHRKELCDFFFPGIVRRGEIVAGVTACGVSHARARQAREAIEQALETLDTKE